MTVKINQHKAEVKKLDRVWAKIQAFGKVKGGNHDGFDSIAPESLWNEQQTLTDSAQMSFISLVDMLPVCEAVKSDFKKRAGYLYRSDLHLDLWREKLCA